MSEETEYESGGDAGTRSGGAPSLRKLYFKELARLREKSGLTLHQLGEQVTYDQSYLYRLEAGERLGSHDVAKALDRYYGTDELLGTLWQHAKEEAQQGRYGGFMDVEAEASSIQECVAGYIPGLLQTERYAEALLNTDVQPNGTEQAVEERMYRQNRIFGTSNLLGYRALIDEAALHHALLDSDAWTEQLQRLLQAADLRHVAIHVMPLKTRPHIMLGSTLTLLWLPSGRNIAYLEGSITGHLVEDSEEVEQLRVTYDRYRDEALSPKMSRALIESVLEDHASCSSLPQT